MFRRYRIVNRVRFTAFLCALILVTVFTFSALFGYGRSEAMDADKYISVEVSYGDTLWNLASEYGPENTDIRKIVFEIERINDVNASTLHPGQVLEIPVK